MKKEDEEKLEKLLECLVFSELSFEDKSFVINALGSEDEFTSLQKIEEILRSGELKSGLLPEPNAFDSIKKKMKERSSSTSWYDLLFRKTPAYVTALLMIFSFGLAALFPLYVKQAEKVMVSTVVKKDTVFVTRIDTVFSERVIYRQAKTISPSFKEIQTAKALERTTPVSTGVSMKDKEELNKLLVSGSD